MKIAKYTSNCELTIYANDKRYVYGGVNYRMYRHVKALIKAKAFGRAWKRLKRMAYLICSENLPAV